MQIWKPNSYSYSTKWFFSFSWDNHNDHAMMNCTSENKTYKLCIYMKLSCVMLTFTKYNLLLDKYQILKWNKQHTMIFFQIKMTSLF